MPRLRTFVCGALALGALLISASAPAYAYWGWRHGPHGWLRFWVAPGVVVGPPVVYAPPPVVYYPPPPVYYAPPPFAYAPPVAFGFGVRVH
jgi:hypothetical protein